MVFGSRGRTPRTSVGWGGGSSGHEPGKSCCQFREKQSEDRFSEEIQWDRMADVLLGKRNSRERKLKSEKQIFFPMSKLKTKSKVFIPSQRFFFLLFGISTGHLSSGTFHSKYPKF